MLGIDNPHADRSTQPSDRIRLSVVIPCRNENQFIGACIRSLIQQDVKERFEIVVADGISTDGTRDTLERVRRCDSRIRVIDNPQQIASTGLNYAIATAKGELVIRTDAHTVYPPDYLSRCLHAIDVRSAWSVGGPQLAASDTSLGRAIAAAYQSSFAVGGAKCHYADHEGPVDHVYLGCWRRHAFLRVGAFDTALVRNQDVEFDLRVSDAGGELWQSPTIQSHYYVRRSLQALFRQNMQFGFWKVQVAVRHPSQLKLRHLAPALFIVMLLSLSIASLLSSSVALNALLVLVAVYFGFVGLGAIRIGLESSARIGVLIPFVLPCYHLGYGYGFLHGIVNLLLGRSKILSQFRKLTR
ncbi:MAG: glycosyltransferase family 2 protein [Planctomycetota bacterium]|nr:glycosyltransferase family 2 protein [Planctomycetota bacterium]